MLFVPVRQCCHACTGQTTARASPVIGLPPAQMASRKRGGRANRISAAASATRSASSDNSLLCDHQRHAAGQEGEVGQQFQRLVQGDGRHGCAARHAVALLGQVDLHRLAAELWAGREVGDAERGQPVAHQAQVGDAVALAAQDDPPAAAEAEQHQDVEQRQPQQLGQADLLENRPRLLQRHRAQHPHQQQRCNRPKAAAAADDVCST